MFSNIAQQVALPLKSATLYQEIIEANAKLAKLERLKSGIYLDCFPRTKNSAYFNKKFS